MGAAPRKLAVLTIAMFVLSARMMPPYSTPDAVANFIVMSNVGLPEAEAPGTMALSTQVCPPSLDTKIGANEPPVGFGVNAVPTICCGFTGFTARLGSLSWCVSPLNALGIMFTTVTAMESPRFPLLRVRSQIPRIYPQGALTFRTPQALTYSTEFGAAALRSSGGNP